MVGKTGKTKSPLRLAAPTLARLPPLTSLRVFVAAARHLSFTRAADELNVSSAAVGQQIKILEAYVGQELFHRDGRQLQLTAAGRALVPGLTEAFEGVLEAISRLAEDDGNDQVRVSVAPSFAVKWLMPRLDALREAVPNLKLVVMASPERADINGPDVDCAIRYGRGAYAGLFVERLFSEAVVPVCSPGFAAEYGLDQPLRSVMGIPLIHEEGPEYDTSCPDWSNWLSAHGFSPRFSDNGFRLNWSSLVIEAAATGQGLGLGKLRLAEADLASGRLIVPFGKPQPIEFSYYFVTTPRKAKSPRLNLFLDWLRGEAQAGGEPADVPPRTLANALI